MKKKEELLLVTEKSRVQRTKQLCKSPPHYVPQSGKYNHLNTTCGWATLCPAPHFVWGCKYYSTCQTKFEYPTSKKEMGNIKQSLTSRNAGEKEEKFNQYLAGVIDGDGSLL